MTASSGLSPDWECLLSAARAVLSPRQISPYMEAGGVGAAVLSEEGHIYTGVCVDTCSSLGLCAERSALLAMITQGENAVRKVVAVMGDGNPGPPCGACREFIRQMMPDKGRDVKFLTGLDPVRIVTLEDLTPMWWI